MPNLLSMEQQWVGIRSALLTSAELLGSFGYSERTLTAHSVVIPIAYYLHRRGLGPNFVSSSAAASDRARIQRWVTKSLMKRGVWGSGLDTLLGRLRDAIRVHGAEEFPVADIEQAMITAGKSLKFEEAEINELLDLKYGSQRVFPVLATLYPGLDLTKSFHEDHIFPRSRFTSKRLATAGVPADQIDDYLAKVDGIANLQLLQGTPNVEKQALLPADWLNGPHFPSEAARQQYVIDNDLVDQPGDLLGFGQFWTQRRTALETRLKAALGLQ